MEKTLDQISSELINSGVTGCIFLDHHGLCVGMKGNARAERAGIISAIAEEASKIEPQQKAPFIHFENDNSSCTIYQTGTVTSAIFQDSTPNDN
ncbi:unnamed protein product [Phaedon cochleariae]|uniref:Late endosomal/lysosomal adaptor and MAPK and MTOR activator 5 n=1 Tax=Phaedon cochleariae TaxID=80249 RepID=A0A9N9SL44_PHACE|nr:unnamed protein product [Phaedon cochleariae]